MRLPGPMNIRGVVSQFFDSLEKEAEKAVSDCLARDSPNSITLLVRDGFSSWWDALGEWHALRGKEKKPLPVRALPKGTTPGWLMELLLAFCVIHVIDASVQDWTRRALPRNRKAPNPALYNVWRQDGRWIRATFGYKPPGINWRPDILVAAGEGDPVAQSGDCVAVAEIKSYSSGRRDETLQALANRVADLPAKGAEGPLALFVAYFGERPQSIPSGIDAVFLGERQGSLEEWFRRLRLEIRNRL